MGEVDEGSGFVEGALRNVDFAGLGEDGEIRGDDAGDQIAAGALEVGGGLGSEGARAAVAGNTGDAEGFVDEELRGVFANGVVGDEARGLLAADLSGLIAEAVGLGEEVVAMGGGVGEQRIAAESGVEAGGAGGGVGGGKSRVVSECCGDGLVQGDGGSGRGLRGPGQGLGGGAGAKKRDAAEEGRESRRGAGPQHSRRIATAA